MKHLILTILFTFSAFAIADNPSTHGMLLFGKKAQYISHLPMFHRPHDYQAVAQVSLGAEVSQYLKDLSEQSGSVIYTLEPEAFSLPERFHAAKGFKAMLYRGHFERGGTPLFEVDVQIQKVIHFRKFSTGGPKPDRYTGLVFGSSDETYLAHLIHSAPDFDQIIPAIVNGEVKEVLSAGAVVLNFSNSKPIEGKACVVAQFGTKMVRIQLASPLYTETGDLGKTEHLVGVR